jgi:hypothetical protein
VAAIVDKVAETPEDDVRAELGSQGIAFDAEGKPYPDPHARMAGLVIAVCLGVAELNEAPAFAPLAQAVELRRAYVDLERQERARVRAEKRAKAKHRKERKRKRQERKKSR